MSEQNNTWTNLLQAGLVEGNPPETVKLESPWFVKVLLGFSAWLASFFLLGFFGIALWDIIDNSLASSATGFVMVGIAFFVLHKSENVFLEQMALVLSLAGQGLILVAIFDVSDSNFRLVGFWVALLQIPLAIFMPNFIHRVLSSYFAIFGISMSLVFLGEPFIYSGILLMLVALLWLNEFRYPRHMEKVRAIAYGFTLGLILVKGSSLFGSGDLWGLSTYNKVDLWFKPWMDEVVSGLVLLYLVWQLLRRYEILLSEPVALLALLGTFLLCLASMEAGGITVGITIVLLGFSSSNRVLLGLGIVSLLFFVSRYYYMLDKTLLAKALTLFLVGIVLIVMRWVMLRFVAGDQESENVQ